MGLAFTYTTSRIESEASSAGQGEHVLGQCPERVSAYMGSGKGPPLTGLQAAQQAPGWPARPRALSDGMKCPVLPANRSGSPTQSVWLQKGGQAGRTSPRQQAPAPEGL